ncbi:hypothetical protein BO221_31925 [Archangium sp. Cb G35]|uniref:hypothetical protein n=1 Tax=Archangium sp. Cb G35 TaxID=1920190 RepID=UPI000935EAEE|nr:hypothetical protein [Archangium sp. Cb G35]OJT20593.1 hypothetical protein BO221_31925 [Archangium sp. Cb G35]
MDCFSVLFLSFFAISLVTGTAYHRGTIRRSENPTAYWVTTIGYLLIGLLIAFPTIMRKLRGH